MEHLINIIEQINDVDMDSNVKLLKWSSRKFQTKVNENLSSAIALSQVELATKIGSIKKVLENIFSLYTKLCNIILFKEEDQYHIDNLEGDMKKIGIALPHF